MSKMTEDVTSTQDSKLNDSSRRLEQRNLVIKRTECPRDVKGRERRRAASECHTYMYYLPLHYTFVIVFSFLLLRHLEWFTKILLSVSCVFKMI